MPGVNFESLAEATSGAMGALVSTTVLCPLDTCKTRSLSDVLFEAVSKRHVLSLYQGLGTKNLHCVLAQFVYCYGYSYFKRLYIVKSVVKSIGTKANLIIAAAAGACTAIITQPLDTASSRMQTSAFGKSKGLFETLSNGSWTEAYDGLGISLILTSNPAIQYTIFDQLKQRHLKGNQSKQSVPGSANLSAESLSAFVAFFLGAVSKSVATIMTYPLIRCKVMVQAAQNDDESDESVSKHPKTITGGLHSIWGREGIPGFFKGLQAQILKTVLTSALLLVVKEKISRFTWILMLAIRRNLLVFSKRPKNA